VLIPNHALRSSIEEWHSTPAAKVLHEATDAATQIVNAAQADASRMRGLRRLNRLEVEPQRISKEEGLDRAAAKGERLLVGAEAVEGAIRAAQLCRASEAADVPLKACRAD
jgi:hypothetical protein